MSVGRVRVGAGFWALLGAAVLVSPVETVLAVLLAAACHELGHLLLLRLFGVRTELLSLSALGAELRAPGLDTLSYGRELAVTLAGPAVNLLCALLLGAAARGLDAPALYLHAGAHVLLGAFNLLPCAPLDGARALYLAAAYFGGPAAGDTVAASVGLGCSLVVLALALRLTLGGGGWLFLFAALGLVCRSIVQIGLAKPRVSV